MQAMIFAAGLGTRLRPLTDNRPKALVEVAGRTLLEHTIMKLRDAGFDRIVVNIHHFGNQIIEFLSQHENFGFDIRLSDERDKLLNTGGGLKHAIPLFRQDEPVLIHNVDIVSDIDVAALYKEASLQTTTTGACLVCNSQPTKRYLLFNDQTELRGWYNVRPEGDVGVTKGEERIEDLRRFHFTGIHVVQPSLLNDLANYLPADGDEAFSIITFYLDECTRHRLVAYELPEGCQWEDCGRVESLPRAAEIIRGGRVRP